MNSPVAIKLLEPWIASDSLGLTRFLREARAAAKLRSPHVVQIFDHGVHEGTPYIVMELLEGESLASRLARKHRLSFPETLRIITHISRALTRAHAAGIVHRDLKPENVFLVNDEEEPPAKLLDFGIAKAAHNAFDVSVEQTTCPGILVGTPFYASPEQAQGAKVLDHRSDIWALGVIAFECLVGERPFLGEALGEVLLAICMDPMPVPSQRGVVPAGFDAWFARACAREIDQRFESAKAAASELAELYAECQPADVRPRPTRPALAPSTLGATVKEVAAARGQRGLTLARAVGAFMVGLALVGAAVWYRHRPLEDEASAEPSQRAPSVTATQKAPLADATPGDVTSARSVVSAPPVAPPGPTVTLVPSLPEVAPVKVSSPAREPARPRPTPVAVHPRAPEPIPVPAPKREAASDRGAAGIPQPSARVSVDLGI